MNTTRTPLFLMANLGAEVSRLLSAKEKGDQNLVTSACSRANDILVQIKAFPEMKPREYEINQLELVINDFAAPVQKLQVSPKDIQAYFIPFTTHLLSQ